MSGDSRSPPMLLTAVVCEAKPWLLNVKNLEGEPAVQLSINVTNILCFSSLTSLTLRNNFMSQVLSLSTLTDEDRKNKEVMSQACDGMYLQLLPAWPSVSSLNYQHYHGLAVPPWATC